MLRYQRNMAAGRREAPERAGEFGVALTAADRPLDKPHFRPQLDQPENAGQRRVTEGQSCDEPAADQRQLKLPTVLPHLKMLPKSSRLPHHECYRKTIQTGESTTLASTRAVGIMKRASFIW